MADDMDDLLRRHREMTDQWYRNREARLTGAASPPSPTAAEVEEAVRELRKRAGMPAFVYFGDDNRELDRRAASLLERLAGQEVEE